jgi:hypothetical protein
MKKIIAKSALALAIATVSGGVFAGTLVTDTFPVKLAEEVFGTGNTTDGSETSSVDTLVATPAVTYTITTANVTGGAAGAVISTVKVTLNSGAVFGEDLSDITKWTASTANVVFGFAPTIAGVVATTNTDGAASVSGDTTAYTVTVDSGGAIGDNTVVFKITSAANGLDLALKTVNLDQIKTKNLTAALKKGGTGPVKMGVEFRRVTAPVVTDTATATVIFDSDPVATLTGTLTTYATLGGRARIDVADTEKTFTGENAASTGANASKDFDVTTVGVENSKLVTLGTLKVVRNETGYAALDLLKKENGDEFDFQGSDDVKVKLTSSSSLSSYDKIYLSVAACDETVPGGAKVGAAVSGDANSVLVDLNGQSTLELQAGYNVCAVAKGNVAIPEATTFDASLTIEYFNPRYTRSESAFSYGPILRNGCQVTLFNLPSVGAADDAFIRITNVSEKPGAVRVSVWPETGGASTIDTNTVVVDSLAAHATAVLHTNADLTSSGVYLGSKLSAFNALAGGRHRLVIQGAFPACEALGLVRASNGQGPLTNMTSTTYSGDETRLGSQNNGTSNTSN